MPPNRFESEVESFLEGSHGDRTHIKRADHPRLHHYAGRYSPPVEVSLVSYDRCLSCGSGWCLCPRVFRAPEGPAAREARRPHFVRRRASKPAQALRLVLHHPHRRTWCTGALSEPSLVSSVRVTP